LGAPGAHRGLRRVDTPLARPSRLVLGTTTSAGDLPCWGRGLRAGQGAAEKIKRENDVHLRQLAKKSTYVHFFFFRCGFGRFSARGVRKHEKKIKYVSKKITGEILFRGEHFFWVIFLTSFPFDFLLRWLSASR
jgi:hypothetical protein